jgi:hypothetical protein
MEPMTAREVAAEVDRMADEMVALLWRWRACQSAEGDRCADIATMAETIASVAQDAAWLASHDDVAGVA